MKLPQNLSQAVEIQNQLAKKVIAEDRFQFVIHIGGIDVHYVYDSIILGYVVMKYPQLSLEHKTAKVFERIPMYEYRPEFLCFSEGIYIVKFLKELKTKPDILILDGHGIAHPRKMGLASYVGVVCDLPTIGCAKNILYGSYDRNKLAKFRSSYVEIKNEFNETIGFALRTKDNVREIFVSVGHKVSLNTAKEIVLKISKYRIPEPLRIAHHIAKFYQK